MEQICRLARIASATSHIPTSPKNSQQVWTIYVLPNQENTWGDETNTYKHTLTLQNHTLKAMGAFLHWSKLQIIETCAKKHMLTVYLVQLMNLSLWVTKQNKKKWKVFLLEQCLQVLCLTTPPHDRLHRLQKGKCFKNQMCLFKFAGNVDVYSRDTPSMRGYLPGSHLSLKMFARFHLFLLKGVGTTKN